MIKLNIYVGQKQLDALRKLKDDNGLPIAEHIRRAIDEYLERRGRGENEGVKG